MCKPRASYCVRRRHTCHRPGAGCSVSVVDLARLMRVLGAHDAMNLDGGASSGLWVEGRYLTAPGRDVSHALVIVRRP
ncbi:MAG: phosphodiester glycosidase family protein [bacterium]